MEREKIIEKIKKLREHSVENGCNEAEAIQFALRPKSSSRTTTWRNGSLPTR